MTSSPRKLKYNYTGQSKNQSVSTMSTELMQARETIEKLNKENQLLNKNVKELILQNFQLKNTVEEQKKQLQQFKSHSKHRQPQEFKDNRISQTREKQIQTQKRIKTEASEKSGDAYRIIKQSHMIDDISQLEEQLRKPTLIQQLQQSKFKKTSLVPSRNQMGNEKDLQNYRNSPPVANQDRNVNNPEIKIQKAKITQPNIQKSKTLALKSRTPEKDSKNSNKPYLHTNQDYLPKQYAKQSNKMKKQQKHNLQQNTCFRVNAQAISKLRQQDNKAKRNNPYTFRSASQQKAEQTPKGQAKRKPSYLDYIPAQYHKKGSPNRLKTNLV